MNRSLLSIVAASVLLAGVGIASAQTTTTTTTTWTNEYGTQIREYSTIQKYNSYSDPAYRPQVGMALPGAVTVYPLPETIVVPSRDTYSYGLINNQPVVIERDSRKVIHVYN
jgi:Protein of unknown function (DUF1236)